MIKRKLQHITALLLLVLVCSISTGVAQHHNLDKKGLALQGYDPVSYFQEIGPLKGSPDITLKHEGVIYNFNSEENRSLFSNNPDRYVPAYGGWCAYAMGDSGKKVSVNPETYTIIDDTLYVFYNAFFINTLTKWKKDEAALKISADKNWNKIITQ